MMLDSPNTWNIGSTVITTSSGWTSNRRPGMSAFMYSWMWVSSAPLGWPVVPEAPALRIPKRNAYGRSARPIGTFGTSVGRVPGRA